MIRDEESLMIRDFAFEQEITIGRVNISVLYKQLNLDQKTIRKYLLDFTTLSELHPEQNQTKTDLNRLMVLILLEYGIFIPPLTPSSGNMQLKTGPCPE
jgi:hypothetical protein